KASVNHVGRTSMEVGVRVEAEDMLTGDVVHVASAYLVFVATDEHGRPVSLPPLLAETDEERRRMMAAETRRSLRLQRPRTSYTAAPSAGEVHMRNAIRFVAPLVAALVVAAACSAPRAARTPTPSAAGPPTLTGKPLH